VKKKLPTPPPDPRVKIRVYRDGLNLIDEFYIEPGQKVVDLDLYNNAQEPDYTIHMNYPAKRVKNE